MPKCAGVFAGLTVFWSVASLPAVAAPPAETSPASQPVSTGEQKPGPVYRVGHFTLQYAYDRPGQPPLEPVMHLPLQLGDDDGVWVAPQEAAVQVIMHLPDIKPNAPRRFAWSGIRTVCERIVEYYNARGFIGVQVGPDPDAIDVAFDPRTGAPVGGKDLRTDSRPGGQAELKLFVRFATVSQVRTIRAGESAAPAGGAGGPRVNNPKDAGIAANSLLKPGGSGEGDRGTGDLLRREPLDSYVYRLDRYPGRHVDVAVSPGRDESRGEVSLDYLLTQTKPWEVYFQLSNTGTRQTSPWRERFGFVDNQLTGRDDILSLDYVTAGFDQSHAVVLAYETPLAKSDRLRLRLHGTYSEFTASELGFATSQFSGDEATGGADLVFNIAQNKQWFLDLVSGVRYQHVHVSNRLPTLTGTGGTSSTSVAGSSDFFLPHIGLQAERNRITDSTLASIDLEGNLADVAGTSNREIQKLGRSGVDRDWAVLSWSGTHSFYLEPLFSGGDYDASKTTPALPSSGHLAHELSFTLKGQYAFDRRLIPQAEDVAGGFYSVRGYGESSSVGDTVVIGSAEYRYHIPRAFGIVADPTKTPLFGRPFRFAPQQPYGLPDWDLIFRTFVDAGQTFNSRSGPGERDETLIGTGLGLELQVQRYLDLRLDWGVALHKTQEDNAGSNRFHFLATFSY